MIEKIFCLLLSGWFALYPLGLAQPNLKEDKKAVELYLEGERLFKATNYTRAQEKFQEIAARKFNLHTTPALYMTGMCVFYQGQYETALDKFQELITAYPQSIYVEEANYHKGLILLQKTEQAKGGLFLLMNLAEDARNASLKQDAELAVNNYLFYDAPLYFLKEYLEMVRPAFYDKTLTAICYRLYKDKNTTELNKYIEVYKKAHEGKLSSELSKIAAPVKTTVAPSAKDKTLRVALMLSFFGNQGDSTRQSEWAIQLLEGVRYAAEMNEYAFLNEVDLKVVDTQKRPDLTETLLRDAIAPFKPDVIIGDIFNGPSKTIAKYAEQHKILQIVPLSPAADIVLDKKYVYLANPSIETQVKGVANYARERLLLKRFLVLDDKSKVSEMLTPDFVKAVRDAKLNVSAYSLPPNIRQAEQIEALVELIKKQKIQAIYFPTNNQSLVSFILTELSKQELTLQALGTPDWSRFRDIPKKLLSEFNTIFPDNYYPQNDSTHFEEFSKAYYEKYEDTPSLQACQGYDIMRFILYNYSRMGPGVSMLDVMEKSVPFRGLNQNYYFAKANDNQSVQLLQYKNERLIKIRLW